ncbi:MAG: RES domain-containing protein [Cyclobacteriaceae bacterium]
MLVYRVSSKQHANDLSGTGAMLFGGRWNMKGTRMVYTSGSLSLATLEIVANLTADKLDRSWYRIEIEIPDQLPIDVPILPKNWNSFPHSGNTPKIGSDFIKRNGLCLKVPSAIIPSEYNYLLNPSNEEFKNIKILSAQPFIIDRRLLG